MDVPGQIPVSRSFHLGNVRAGSSGSIGWPTPIVSVLIAQACASEWYNISTYDIS